VPIQECSEGNRAGFRFGESGKCYLHDGSKESIGKAKEAAYKQGIAMGEIQEVKLNAEELTREYLLAFYSHAMEHPDIFGHIKEAIHLMARGSAGGKLHGKKLMEEDDEEAGQAEPMPKLNLHFNNAEFGKVLYKDDDITVLATTIMQERVTNGAMKLYDEFKDSVHWWKNKPVIPPHAQGDPPVNHRTKIAGKVLDAWLNPEKRSIDGATLFYNARIAPNDLTRMWEGEKFGNSPGYYCNDEALPGTWEGTEYKTTERGPYYPDHLSMVPRGACPLPHCGFNLEVPVDEARIARLLDGIKLNFEVQRMTEEIPKAEVPKTNAEIKPTEAIPPTVNVAVDLSTVLTRLDAISTEFATLKANIAEKDTKIATLEAAETIRQNAAKEQAIAAAKAGFAAILNANAKMDIEKLYPEYEKSPALWIVTNTKLLDVKGIEAGIITPAGQPFVPHINATDEDPYEAAGAKAADDMISKKVA